MLQNYCYLRLILSVIYNHILHVLVQRKNVNVYRFSAAVENAKTAVIYIRTEARVHTTKRRSLEQSFNLTLTFANLNF